MPVPFEGLLPYAIMTAFFGLAGHGVGFIRYWDNGWKKDRFDLDEWDERMMKRDFMLTGVQRGQSSDAIAPEHFKTSDVKLQRYYTPYRDQFFSLREIIQRLCYRKLGLVVDHQAVVVLRREMTLYIRSRFLDKIRFDISSLI